MTGWSPEELSRIGRAEELKLASRRRDGTLRPYVTMWVLPVGDDLYLRAAYGPNTGWYRRARSSGRGRIRAGGGEKDVVFEHAPDGVHREIDAAYHAKYDRSGPRIVGTVVGEDVVPLTIRLRPAV